MINELEEFRKDEIRNIKKLRAVAWLFLIISNLSIMAFFLYGFYSVYAERNIQESFIYYTGKTILAIQAILILPLGFLGIIFYRRFYYAIKEIANLNEEYLQCYYDYVHSIERAFTGIPPYLFTQNGLIIQNNFSQEIYPANSIDRLTIKIVSRGNLPRNHIIFYQNSKKKSSLTFIGFQTKRLEHIKKNVKKDNPFVIIEEGVDAGWF